MNSGVVRLDLSVHRQGAELEYLTEATAEWYDPLIILLAGFCNSLVRSASLCAIPAEDNTGMTARCTLSFLLS